MKKIIDSIAIRAIAHATEDLDKVKQALEFISGRSDFEVLETKGYHGNKIIVLRLEIKKNMEIKEFWKHLLSLGIEQEIMPFLDDLITEEGTLHMRFDKQEAYRGRLAIVSGGDTIALRVKILSYPRKKSVAIKNFEEFIRMIRAQS